jgi:1-acyl-sn-glycerol-3-phosphate acyltransferase
LIIPRTTRLLKVIWLINRLWNALWYGVHRIGPCTVPAEGPVILTANHGSTADPMMLYATCHTRLMGFMIAREYAGLPILRHFINMVHCIPVNRDGRDTAATKAAIRQLRGGGMLGIFIEGRIAPPGTNPPPKDGVALLALQTGATVVPAYISGLIYHHNAVRSFFTRHRAKVRYGPPVDLSDIQGKGRDAAREATARIWSAIQQLKADARATGEL